MQTFEKENDQTMRVITTFTKEELIPVDQIISQIKGYEDQIAYSNEKIAELRILLSQAISLGIVAKNDSQIMGDILKSEVL